MLGRYECIELFADEKGSEGCRRVCQKSTTKAIGGHLRRLDPAESYALLNG